MGGGVGFRSSASCRLPPARLRAGARILTCTKGETPSNTLRVFSPLQRSALLAVHGSTPPTSPINRKPRRLAGLLTWRWGELNPRPGTRKEGFYRFRRPFGLSGGGRRTAALSLPYPAWCFPRPAGMAGDELRFGCRPLTALGAALRGVRHYRCLRSESEIAVIVGN